MAPPVVLEVKHGQKNAKGYPTKLEGMIVVTRERSKANGDNFSHAKDVMEALPKDEAEQLVKKIPIRLISDNYLESFHMYRGFYGKGKLACGANYGEDTAMRMFKGSEWVEPYPVKCDSECPYWNREKEPCDLGGTLYFNLGKSLPRNNDLVLYRINGRHAQRRMLASLSILSGRTGGIMAGLPLQIAFYNDLVKDGTNKTRSVPIIVVEPEDGTNLEESVATELRLRREIIDIKRSLGIQVVGSDASYMRTGMLEKIQHREIITSMEELDEVDDNRVAFADNQSLRDSYIEDICKKFPWVKPALIGLVFNKHITPEGDVDIDKVGEEILRLYPKKED